MNRPHLRISATAKFALAAASIACGLTAVQPCFAASIVDAVNDYNSTYIGPMGPGLDVLSFSVTNDNANFYISGTLDGVPGTTGSRYNVGIDRGAGRYQFGAGIRPDILIDAAVNLFPATNSGQATLIGPPDMITQLTPGAVTITDNTISAVVPINLLPSTGFAPEDYKFYFWSRINIAPPLYYGIADFAGTGPLTSTAVPEPSTWALMLVGLAGVGAVMRRRRPALIESTLSADRGRAQSPY